MKIFRSFSLSYISPLFLLLSSNLLGADYVDFKTFTSQSSHQFLLVYQGKEVETRGFLSSEDKRNYFLAEDPLIKSCCLQPGVQAKKAIVVQGMGLEPFIGKKVKLRGTLYWNQEDPYSGIQLLAAIPVEDDDVNYVIFLLSLASLLLIFFCCYGFIAKRIGKHF